MRIEQLLFLAAVLVPIACGTSGANPDGTGGAAGSGGSGDDLTVAGGAASGGSQATGAASSSGGDATSGGGSGGGGEVLDMERVLRARKVRRRFSLGDRNDRDACLVRESGGLACSTATFRTVNFDKLVDLVTFSGLGYCVSFDDQTVSCRPATSDPPDTTDFAASIETAEDVFRFGSGTGAIEVGGGVRMYGGPDVVLTHPCPSGSTFGGLDSESCVLEPEGRVTCFWAIPGIADAPDKTEFDLENTKYIDLSQSLSLFAAIDEGGALRVRAKREDKSITYPGKKFVQVAATSGFWCMLTNAGTVQCDTYDYVPSGVENVPSGEFIAIDVNEQFACAVRPTAEIVCWGQGAPTFTDKVRLD